MEYKKLKINADEGERNYSIAGNERVLHDITSIVELVDSLIAYGLYRNASDIHIDPSVDGLNLRMRLDGILT